MSSPARQVIFTSFRMEGAVMDYHSFCGADTIGCYWASSVGLLGPLGEFEDGV